MSEATAHMARGMVRQLRMLAPLLPFMLDRLPADVAQDFKHLCDRADAAVADAELSAVFDEFMSFTTKYGLLALPKTDAGRA